MSEKILFVDDESSALEGFRRILYRNFNVHTATSGGEGLALLEREGPFAVVVSDMRMPGMNGAEFLARVRQKAPLTVRMLLTGHADLHAAIDAVNRGQILHFLTKPCERTVLIAAINSGLDQYRAAREESQLAAQARSREYPPAEQPAPEASRWESFHSPIGLPGRAEARAILEPLAGNDAQTYTVLLRLAVLDTVEQRYGQSASTEYLRAVTSLLQRAFAPGDRLFHWRPEILLGVLRRYITPEAVRMEIERIIADTRSDIIEVHGKPMMIACLITFDLVPVARFASYAEWRAAFEARCPGQAGEGAGAP